MSALHMLLVFSVLATLGQNALGAKIIGGKKAPPNSMQFMASLQDRNGHHYCGGFLITDKFVVSAAHCPKPVRVVLGTHDLNRSANRQITTVKEEHKHPYFDMNNIGNGYDIMLLELSERAQIGNNIRTVPLPSHNTIIRENEKCHLAGWGLDKTNGETVDELREVEVSIIKRDVCKEQWQKLPDNVICAGGYQTTKGSCQGDSGGPLVCNGIAVGIVSYNHEKNCNYPEFPNVYTDVSGYLPWIKGIIGGTKYTE